MALVNLGPGTNGYTVYGCNDITCDASGNATPASSGPCAGVRPYNTPSQTQVNCSGENNDGVTLPPGNAFSCGNGWYYCAALKAVPSAPEMSDYLAVAFIIVAGGFVVYRTRKRKTVTV